MPRKSISGFAEAGAAMAQQLDDNDLLNLFSAVGRVVSKRFLMKRPCLNSWQLVLDYLKSAMGFEPREQFRVLYLDKRNNLIADEVLAEGTVDHTPVYPREVLRRAIELHATGCVLVHNHPSGDATPSRADIDMTKQVAEGCNLLGIAVHEAVEGGAFGTSQHDILRWRWLTGRSIGAAIVRPLRYDDKVACQAIDLDIHRHAGLLGRPQNADQLAFRGKFPRAARHQAAPAFASRFK
jgi:DNA repair protein RadC